MTLESQQLRQEVIFSLVCESSLTRDLSLKGWRIATECQISYRCQGLVGQKAVWYVVKLRKRLDLDVFCGGAITAHTVF